jgi:hypothetical protein
VGLNLGSGSCSFSVVMFLTELDEHRRRGC